MIPVFPKERLWLFVKIKDTNTHFLSILIFQGSNPYLFIAYIAAFAFPSIFCFLFFFCSLLCNCLAINVQCVDYSPFIFISGWLLFTLPFFFVLVYAIGKLSPFHCCSWLLVGWVNERVWVHFYQMLCCLFFFFLFFVGGMNIYGSSTQYLSYSLLLFFFIE